MRGAAPHGCAHVVVQQHNQLGLSQSLGRRWVKVLVKGITKGVVEKVKEDVE